MVSGSVLVILWELILTCVAGGAGPDPCLRCLALAPPPSPNLPLPAPLVPITMPGNTSLHHQRGDQGIAGASCWPAHSKSSIVCCWTTLSHI